MGKKSTPAECNSPQAFLDLAGVVCMILDRDGKISFLNPKGCSLLGIRTEDAVGTDWFSQYTSEDEAEHARKIFNELLAGEHPRGTSLESNIKRSANTPLTLVWQAKGFTNEAGEVTAVIQCGVDETKRKAGEKRLNFTQFTVDQAKIAVFWCYSSGHFFYVNDTAIEWLQYSMDELMKMHVADINPEFPRSAWDEHWREIKENGMVRIESVHRRKNGEVYPVEIYSNHVQFEGEEYKLAFVTDISDRKQVEEERDQFEAQLRQAEKLKAIGQLAGGVAHDFNNQLGGMLGYMEILRKKLSGNNELTDIAENVIAAIERAAGLTSQLLAFARKGKYHSEDVDVHALIHEVTSLLEHTLDKRIEISTDLNAESFTTRGDPSQLQSVILNLAINARDAMVKGGKLRIATNVVELDEHYFDKVLFEIEPGPFVQVCVSDTGMGIPPQNLSRIFEPFFTTKTPGKGSGMGLSAVYGILKTHKGAMDVYTEVGHGTVIKLYLPLKTGDDKVDSTPAPRGEIELKKAHILLIDDDDTVLNVTADMLSVLDHEVAAFDSAAEAIAFYKSNWRTIDCVIIDMVMPGMEGGDVFSALQEINPDIRAILSSGFSINDIATRIQDLGVKGFLQKPYRMSSLSQKIQELLNGD